MSTPVLAPWQRPEPDLSDYAPVVAYPAPKRPDPGPARAPAAGFPAPAAGAPAVAYVPAPAPPRPAPPRPGGPAWHPSPGPATSTTAAPALPAGPAKVTWCRPPIRGARPASQGRPQVTVSPAYCTGDINYDPPEYSFGTGLQQTNPDGSWVVYPLSVVEPGCEIGDEGPINEALLSTPVVWLAAGRPYVLASQVVIPNGATLHCNRAAIDRDMFVVGEGAAVFD